MGAPKKIKSTEVVKNPVLIKSETGFVTIVSTGKSPFMKPGKEFNATDKHAQTLIKRGFAKLKQKK